MAKVLHGDAGGNQLNVSVDKTQAYGLKGNDTLISDGKSDVLLVGGGGDDSLIVIGGEATLSGGDGADTFELNYSAEKKLSAVIEDLQPSEDKIVVNFDGSTAPQISAHSISGGNVVLQDGDGLFKVTLKSVRDNDYFDSTASVEAWKVLELTNAEREAASLSPLTMSDDLTAGASIRVQEITELGKQGELDVYRHRRPNNEHFSTVLKKVYNHPVGENLEAGARSPDDVMSQWMSSESHKENILNSSYQKLGVGYNYDDEDPSDQRWYWVQLFANNLKSPESINATNLSRANISRDTVSKFIAGDDNANTLENSDYGVTIDALGGNDSVNNSGLNVSISGGADDDTIENSGSFSTINAGDGNDSVSGFHSGDTLKILDDEFTPATVGNDIIVGVGNDSIKLLDAAASSGVQIEGTRSKLIIGTDDDETYNNNIDNATIKALGGNDYIKNYGSSSILDGGDGDDDIYNEDLDAEDYDYNFDFEYDEEPVELYGGKGDDVIYNIRSHCAGIYSGDGNDYILNNGFDCTLDGGAGDDTVRNNHTDGWVLGEEGDDRIENSGEYSTIFGGAGNDSIINDAENASLDGGDGDDYIYQASELLAYFSPYLEDKTDTSIKGGAGNDTIEIDQASEVTINGGAGDDDISNLGSNNLIDLDDGNDTIWGLKENDSLQIGEGHVKYSTVASGDDIEVKVGNNTITLKNFRDDPEDIIIGESGTSGGSGSSSGSGSGSSGTSGTSSSQGSNTSGGTSASANSNSDASGGQSASGSSGTSASSGGNGSSGRGNSSSTTAAGNSIFEPITIPETLSTTPTTRTTTNSNPLNTSVTTTQGTYSGNIMSPVERTYTGATESFSTTARGEKLLSTKFIEAHTSTAREISLSNLQAVTSSSRTRPTKLST